MKIRSGFVSNSSSSSFHIYGICLEESDMRKIIIKEELATEDELKKYGHWEFFGEFESEIKQLSCFGDMEHGCVYIGRRYSSIKNDETGGEFKKSTKKLVKKHFGEKLKCHEYEETIYS